MKRAGFTIIELMIASSILLIALASISIVYLSGERLMYSGINQADVQRKAQILGGNITRWIRPASSVTVMNNGDMLEIVVPLSIDPDSDVTRRIYYEDGGIYYDSDINDNNPAMQVAGNVYKTEDRVFRNIGDLVYVDFGIESVYLHGPSYPVETELKIKVRNTKD